MMEWLAERWRWLVQQLRDPNNQLGAALCGLALVWLWLYAQPKQ